jgi:hypothetical protein
MFLARAFCMEAKRRTKGRVLDIESGEYACTDNLHLTVAKRIIECKGYFAAHPLTRTFW